MFGISTELLLIVTFGLIAFGFIWMFWSKIKVAVDWHLFKRAYPVRLHVLKRRGDGMIYQRDKASVKYDKALDKEYYDTVKNGKMPRIDPKYMTSDNHAWVFEIAPKQFKQININEVPQDMGRLKLESLSESQKEWYASEIKKREKFRRKDFLTGVMPYISIIFVGIIILAMLNLIALPLIGAFETTSNAMVDVSANLVQVSQATGSAESSPDRSPTSTPINRTINNPPPGSPPY